MCTLCIDDHFSETQINSKVQRTSMLGGKQYWHNSTLHFISYQLFLFHCKTSVHLINHRAFPFVWFASHQYPRCCTVHQLEAKCVSQYCTGSAQRISALKDKKTQLPCVDEMMLTETKTEALQATQQRNEMKLSIKLLKENNRFEWLFSFRLTREHF